MNQRGADLKRISMDLLHCIEAFHSRAERFITRAQDIARDIDTIKPPPPRIDLETALSQARKARADGSRPRRTAIRKILLHAGDQKVPLDILEWLVRKDDMAARELGASFFLSWPTFFDSQRGRELVAIARRLPNRSTASLTEIHEDVDYFAEDLIFSLTNKFPAPLSASPAEWLREIAVVFGIPIRFQEILRLSIISFLGEYPVQQVKPFNDGWLGNLINDLHTATRLLPIRIADSGAGFLPGLDPTAGQTDFLAYCIQTCIGNTSRKPSTDSDAFHDFLFATFKDPRLNSAEPVWRELRARHKSLYDAFIQALSVGDLEFFFEQLDDNEKDPARATFWKKYVGGIRNTRTFLKSSTASRILRTAERTGDPKVSRAASQAIAFQTDSLSTSPTFCMYFDRYVVVEFLMKGNAMYIYDRRVFEEKIMTRFQARPKSHDIFKQQNIAVTSCIHRSGGWEAEFTRELAALGITRSTGR